MKFIKFSNIILIFKYCNLKFFINVFSYIIFDIHGDWGWGIGDWGLGIGDWAQSPIPNPQSPFSLFQIPKPNK